MIVNALRLPLITLRLINLVNTFQGLISLTSLNVELRAIVW